MTRDGLEQERILAALAMTKRDARRWDLVLRIRDDLFRQGRELGISTTVLGHAAGVSDSRVRQITPPELSPAAPDVSRETPTVPTLPAGAPLLSEYASRCNRQPYAARMGAWVDLEDLRGITDDGRRFHLAGDTARDVLTGVPKDVERVFLCGAPPQGPGTNQAMRIRAWGLEPLGNEWRISTKGHYVADTDSPCFRFTLPAMSYDVEILFGSSWFGPDIDAMTGHDAWNLLRKKVQRAFPGSELLSTPATTGRALWARTIPAGKSWPVMSPELRELIASTSGQGRMELLESAGGIDSCDEFTYLDARFSYAALTWGMPVGEPYHWHARDDTPLTDEAKTVLLKSRGRWRVYFTVPASWAHVGILPVKDETGGWTYPSGPGIIHETWADACEVSLAHQAGWSIELLEGFTWAEGKPLDMWTTKIKGIHADLRDSYLLEAPAAARGARAMLLHAIGAFATRAHLISRSVSLDQEDKVPDNARVTVVGGELVWEEPAKQSTWTLNQSHPEWSAAIWARARVRLLDSPGANGGRVGALHVPRDEIIAFRTDAIYLNADPGWPDDGKIGRFRVKGKIRETRPWPQTNTELFQLRDESEGKQ
jgi:hypothetical protein